MANLNRIILIGRVQFDPDLRYTVEEVPMVKLRLAVSRAPRAGTDFVDVVYWRRLAETTAQYVKKGSLVLVEGTLQTRNYETSDGRRRYVTEVMGREIKFLSKKEEAVLPSNPPVVEDNNTVEKSEPELEEVAESEEGLPF